MTWPGLWICGDSRAELFAPDSHPHPGTPLWAWDSRNAEDLPERRRAWFQGLDEVKPVALGGTPCVLITSSSSGGAVLVRRSDRKVLFSVFAANAHSADLLPGGWLAVAASIGTDKLCLFRIREGQSPESPDFEVPLAHAHGAVWDAHRQALWTCGANQVVQYGLLEKNSGLSLREDARIKLPDNEAHDLAPDRIPGVLLVTTGNGVWRIEIDGQRVLPYAPLAQIAHVKSVSVEAASGALAFQKGEGGAWWSENVYVLTPDGRLQMRTLPGRRLYKVRWDQHAAP